MNDAWPALPYEDWVATYKTLHRYAQIVGKIKLSLAQFLNEWWHVALTVSSRGLTTGAIPYGTRLFEINFDFIDHRVDILCSDGASRGIDLKPMSVADFYEKMTIALRSLGIDVAIDREPKEITSEVLPLDTDTIHATYEREQAHRAWQALVQVDRVFQQFRSDFSGKSSPSLFFWGSFDLAVSRFSGNACPVQPQWDRMLRLSHDEEHFAAGFWPGNEKLPKPVFYSYIVPKPDDFEHSLVEPASAYWDNTLGEFILPYDDVRTAADPDKTLLAFLNSSYAAAADLAGWNRKFFERRPR